MKTVKDQINYRKLIAEEIKNTPNLVSATVDEDGFPVLSFKHLKYYVMHPASHTEMYKKEDAIENEFSLQLDLSN